jgi:hypothetical protein
MTVTSALVETAFRNFVFRHFGTLGGEVFRHFNSRYPELRNGVKSTVRCSSVFHFGILVVKDLDISNSQYPNLRYVVCDISRLRVSRFRDSCDEESSLLTTPTPGIQNSGMESLSFHDFGFCDFGTLHDKSFCHFHLPVSEIPVSNSSKWSRINSPRSP